MNNLTVILVILIIILIYNYCYKYGPSNTIPVSPCFNCEKYNVHRSHADQVEAAGVMKEVVRRNKILIEHLKNKYLSGFQPNMDNLKNNRIDIIPSGSLSTDLYNINPTSPREAEESEYVRERMEQLVDNYNSDRIYEISPLNKSNLTSYTQDKKTLILCLRKKHKNNSGENELHDINTIMFVVLHELSHMANNEYDHPPSFWLLFKFILMNAVECGIYEPVDYRKHPINYCGLDLGYNPLYDNIV